MNVLDFESHTSRKRKHLINSFKEKKQFQTKVKHKLFLNMYTRKLI